MVYSEIIGQRIRSLRNRLGKNQIALAAEAGCSQSTISKLEAGLINIPIKKLEAIAEVLGVGLGDLVPRSIPGAQETSIGVGPPDGKETQIIFYGARILIRGEAIAADQGDLLSIREYETPEVSELVMPCSFEGEIYGLRVRGRSMEPVIKDGSVVIASVRTPPQTQDFVIIRLRTGIAYVKRFVVYNGKHIFEGLNPMHSSILLKKSEIEMMHKVIAISFQ